MGAGLGRDAQRLAQLGAHRRPATGRRRTHRLELRRQVGALRAGRRARRQVGGDDGVDAPARQFAGGEPQPLRRRGVGQRVAEPVERVGALALALADAGADGLARVRQRGAIERDAQRAHQQRAHRVGGQRDGRILERGPRRRRHGPVSADAAGSRPARSSANSRESERICMSEESPISFVSVSGASACVRCGAAPPYCRVVSHGRRQLSWHKPPTPARRAHDRSGISRASDDLASHSAVISHARGAPADTDAPARELARPAQGRRRLVDWRPTRQAKDTMIDKIVESAAAALADVRDGATVMIGGFGTAGLPDELIAALMDQGARDLVVVNNNAGNGDTGLAALLARRPRAQDHLQLSAPGRFLALRPAVPRRQDRARARAAGQPGRTHPRRRRRHRRVLHAHRLRHDPGRGQGDARDRRQDAGARIRDPRRRRADQGRTRRPLGQPHLPHDRAQLRARSWRWPPGAPSPPCTRWSNSARSIPRPSSRQGLFVQRVVPIPRTATRGAGFKAA